jgi:5-methyltetrahydrofolate--homocysteine methyltransferase
LKKLIIDGAIGTLLLQKHLPEEVFRGEQFKDYPLHLIGNFDVLNHTQPAIVRQIHQDYINAGADIIKTNTFNANKISQQPYGLQDDVYEMNFAGVTIVKEAILRAKVKLERKVFIAGSIGPTPLDFSKIKSKDRDKAIEPAMDAYRPQVAGLLDAGVDYFLVETVVHSCSAEAALIVINEALRNTQKNIPVIVSVCADHKNGLLYSGESLCDFSKNIQRFQLYGIGFNCVDLDFDYIPLYESLREIQSSHLCFMPGISLVDYADESKINPEIFAEKLLIFAQRACVDIVGGCCGTTPAFIESIFHYRNKIS